MIFMCTIQDNAAGICAFRYCRTNVVTAAINDVDFHERISLGDLVIVSDYLWVLVRIRDLHEEFADCISVGDSVIACATSSVRPWLIKTTH